MYTVMLAFGSLATTLSFKTEERAMDAYARALASHDAEKPLELVDDFGQQIGMAPGSLAMVAFDDLSKSKEARIEISLHQARMQHSLQQRAAADPALQRSSLMQGGPAMLSPMGNGRF